MKTECWKSKTWSYMDIFLKIDLENANLIKRSTHKKGLGLGKCSFDTKFQSMKKIF